MKVPFSWLKDYVDITVSAEELQEKLFSCGFEVEELSYLGEKVNRVVVGEITKIEKHPDSDHLLICMLDCGEEYGRELQIVTGASNVFVGAKVPVALDDSTVVEYDPARLEKDPSGIKKIKKGKLRGVESNGMLCSGQELGINDDFYPGAEVNGILILAEDTPIGEDIRKVVGLDDYLFDIAVTANRPDCQCVFGIAREVAAVLKTQVKEPNFTYTEHKTDDKKVKVSVLAPDLCPRYMGHRVENIKIEKSPAWLRKRLALCGIRSISNVVDITNFVLLELGQPMHSFDLGTLQGEEIVVRRALDGEKIQTLDEKEFALTKENLVICDGEKPVALAGVMGGLNSEITDKTSRVYFESAKFARDNVRHTARALGQSTDSSARYEKGVDAYTTERGLKRALHLIEELGCGTVTTDGTDECAVPVTSKVIEAKISKINGILGITVPTEEILSILSSLNFKVTLGDDGDEIKVEVPPYREDVDSFPDLAEEVIREYGYDKIIPTFLPTATITHGGWNEEQKKEDSFKKAIILQGFMESISYSFFSPKDFDLIHLPSDAPERNAIAIKNPLGEDLSLMRTTLIPEMLANVVRNVRRGNEEGKLFEMGNIYLPRDGEVLPEEKKTVSLALWGNGDFFTLKGAVEYALASFGLKATFVRERYPFLHPGVSASVMLGEKKIGFLGELDPVIAGEQALEKKVYLAQLSYEEIAKKYRGGTKYIPVPAFPAVKRDLALIVAEEVPCAEIEETIFHACRAVSAVELFDVFRGKQVGENKKSMAFSVTFTPEENATKPLSGEQVDSFVKKILSNLKFKLNAEIRS